MNGFKNEPFWNFKRLVLAPLKSYRPQEKTVYVEFCVESDVQLQNNEFQAPIPKKQKELASSQLVQKSKKLFLLDPPKNH